MGSLPLFNILASRTYISMWRWILDWSQHRKIWPLRQQSLGHLGYRLRIFRLPCSKLHYLFLIIWRTKSKRQQQVRKVWISEDLHQVKLLLKRIKRRRKPLCLGKQAIVGWISRGTCKQMEMLIWNSRFTKCLSPSQGLDLFGIYFR